jgi:hypothetical protein
MKIGASSSAATANALTAEFCPSIDRKKGRFLGLFCRKTGVRRKLFNTLLCVFTCFWDSRLFQTVAPQWDTARGSLKNKSYPKTYRRFFVCSGMCLNKSMKVKMTGRDEGCGRSAALRAAALLSAPPTTALQSESCGSKRRPLSVPSRRRDANRCNFDQSGCNPTQSDCNSRRGIAPDCTRLHQIAPNCGHCAKQSIGRKTDLKKSVLLLSFCLHLIACKVAEASCLLALKAQRLDAAATFPGSLMPAPHRLSETLNLVGFNLRQSKLIQVNPT